MSVKTKIVWGDGWNEDLKDQWDTFKSEWLSKATDAGKTDGFGTEGVRTWVDQSTADQWKALAQEFSRICGIKVTVSNVD